MEVGTSTRRMWASRGQEADGECKQGAVKSAKPSGRWRYAAGGIRDLSSRSARDTGACFPADLQYCKL
eukprot:618603-Pelagomonas_calceolata.AAC.1